MRIGVSNIAWDIEEDDLIASIFQASGVDAIDIAPGKYFPNIEGATDAEIKKVQTWWRERGVEITGMQSLLFGTTGLNVFSTEEVQKALLNRLEAVCRIAGKLESPKLVFGSPKNRDVGTLKEEESKTVALKFFTRLGDIAAKHGVIICLEPNPVAYGCNFMVNSTETASVVKAINHSAIKMQFDTGAVTMNGEDPQSVLRDYASLIGHVHISEPSLLAVGKGDTNHSQVAEAVQKYLPASLLMIEMVATRDESHSSSIDRAIKTAKEFYYS